MLIVLGIGLLTAGGEALIRGALAAARRLGVSPLLSGLVIVGFGTSMPELVVSLDAAVNQRPDIAVGNVVGSNIGNILLILGLCAAITPLAVHPMALGYLGWAYRTERSQVTPSGEVLVAESQEITSLPGSTLLMVVTVVGGLVLG